MAFPLSVNPPPMRVENSRPVPFAFNFVTNASFAPVLTPPKAFTREI